MCYLVTGLSLRTSSRFFAIYDTEEIAKQNAERLLGDNLKEVAIWKQIATPKVEKIISW